MSDKPNSSSQKLQIDQHIHGKDNQTVGYNYHGVVIQNLHGNVEYKAKPRSISFIDQSTADVETWCGRTEELCQVTNWLQDSKVRLIGITGAGGYGKSALATKLYQTVVDEGNLSYQIKCWINFRQSYSFSFFGREILKLFSCSEINEDVKDEELLNAVLDYLTQGNCLLVLDNIESLLQSNGKWQEPVFESFFLNWLECSSHSNGPIKSKILVTSREQLSIPQNKLDRTQWILLEGLSIDAGEDLLRKLNIKGESLDFQEFVKLADGHPLLLNLAASLLKDEKGDTPNIEALKLSSLNLYEIMGLHRGDPESNVKKLLDASIERLEKFKPKLKHLLLNLSVYRISFDYNAAVAMIDEAFGEKELRSLVKRSLLQEERQQEIRKFKFQPLIQHYLQQLTDKTDAHERAINYYKSVAKQSISRSNHSLGDFTEHLELFQHYCQLKQYFSAYLTHQGTKCAEIMSNFGYNHILIELYEPLTELWKPNKDNKEEQLVFGSLLCSIGMAYTYLGELVKAREYFNKYLCSTKLNENKEGEASALNGLGWTFHNERDYSKAIEYFKQGLEVDASSERLDILNNLGLAYHHKKNYQKAIEIFTKILECERLNEDSYAISSSLCNLANSYRDNKQYEEAINCFEEAIEILKESPYLQFYANTLDGLGLAYTMLNKYEEAKKNRKQALKIYQNINYFYGKIYSIDGLISIYEKLGDMENLKDMLNQKIACHRQMLELKHNTQYSQAQAFFEIGIALRRLNRNWEAQSALQNAYNLFQELELTLEAQRCGYELSRLNRMIPIDSAQVPSIGEPTQTSNSWWEKSLPTPSSPKSAKPLRQNWLTKLFSWFI